MINHRIHQVISTYFQQLSYETTHHPWIPVVSSSVPSVPAAVALFQQWKHGDLQETVAVRPKIWEKPRGKQKTSVNGLLIVVKW